MPKIPKKKEMQGEDKDCTPLTFGKYKGETPDEISDHDPGYIVWAWENLEFKPCSRAMYYLCLKDKNDNSFEKEISQKYPDWTKK